MPRKKTESIDKSYIEALKQVSNDISNLAKAIHKIVDNMEIQNKQYNDMLKSIQELAKSMNEIVEKISNMETRLEKLSKSLYWHRRTIENQQYQKRNYNKSYGKRYRKSHKRYQK